MKIVKTNDGSITYHNEKFGETYHSISGAIDESIRKFVEPCNIDEISCRKSIRVLDVCFGLGYNSLAFIYELFKRKTKCKIEIIALENDPEIMEKMFDISFDNELRVYYYFLKRAVNDALFDGKKFCKEGLRVEEEKILYKLEKNVKIDFKIKDAREAVNEINGEFEIVFLDPFSPKKCPELWEEQFIADIGKKCSVGCVLTTYSCARIARDNLQKAGFDVKDGPVVGRRAPSTIGVKR